MRVTAGRLLPVYDATAENDANSAGSSLAFAMTERTADAEVAPSTRPGARLCESTARPTGSESNVHPGEELAPASGMLAAVGIGAVIWGSLIFVARAVAG